MGRQSSGPSTLHGIFLGTRSPRARRPESPKLAELSTFLCTCARSTVLTAHQVSHAEASETDLFSAVELCRNYFLLLGRGNRGREGQPARGIQPEVRGRLRTPPHLPSWPSCRAPSAETAPAPPPCQASLPFFSEGSNLSRSPRVTRKTLDARHACVMT